MKKTSGLGVFLGTITCTSVQKSTRYSLDNVVIFNFHDGDHKRQVHVFRVKYLFAFPYKNYS